MMLRPPPLLRLAPALALAPLLLLLTGCGGQAPAGGGKAGKGAKGGAAPVLVARAERKVVPLALEAIGAVEPIRSTAVRSQVTGTLLKRVIREGQDVRQGEVLFEIDPRPFRNALQAAEADLQKVRVQLETARAQVARYRSLTADQMVSKEQFEKINDTARALEAEALSVESRLATARIQLEYCSIRAPLAGRSGQISLHEGDIVRANDTGIPLTTIHQLSPINVTFGVPQQYLGALQRYRAAGQLAVAATPPGADEKPENGELTFLDNAVESATGTLRLKAAFPNAAQRLWPGQFVTVALTLANPEVIAIPASALQTSQAGQYVYVVKADRTAELRPVTVERTVGAEAVIAQGLAPGETVVAEGQLRVVPGRAVDVRDAAGGARPAAKAAPGAKEPKGGKEAAKP
jgi:multidrug efflux system membrane fusion protein